MKATKTTRGTGVTYMEIILAINQKNPPMDLEYAMCLLTHAAEKLRSIKEYTKNKQILKIIERHEFLEAEF